MVLIAGLGTLGAHLAEHLARQGTPLTVLDFDVVEARNLQNQPYFAYQLGQPKALALSQNLSQATGTARIKPVQLRLDGQNGARAVKEAEIVVDAFDNHASRLALQAVCRERKKRLLHLGISLDGYGEVVWDERYAVPPDQPRDACAEPASRALALLVTAMAARSLQSGKDYCVTWEDLALSPR